MPHSCARSKQLSQKLYHGVPALRVSHSVGKEMYRKQQNQENEVPVLSQKVRAGRDMESICCKHFVSQRRKGWLGKGHPRPQGQRQGLDPGLLTLRPMFHLLRHSWPRLCCPLSLAYRLGIPCSPFHPQQPGWCQAQGRPSGSTCQMKLHWRV